MKTVKYIIALSVTLVCCFAIQSCKKDKKNPQQTAQINTDVRLDPADEAFLASVPKDHYANKDITLPNGQNLQEYIKANLPELLGAKSHLSVNSLATTTAQKNKTDIIAKMGDMANKLIDWPSINDEGTNKPAQVNGLAYVWGAKEHTERHASSEFLYINSEKQSVPGECTELLHGLDCSGFVYQMAKAAGLTFDATPDVAYLSNADNWNKAIQAKGFKKLKMEKVAPDKIVAGDLQTGDIIYWNSHIGMIQMTPNGPEVYNSHGDPSLSCGENSSASRGPSEVPLSQMLTWGKGFKTWGVLRLTIEISGQWTLDMRCSGTNSDIFSLDLNFPANASSTFSLKKTAPDYDGSSNNFILTFNYNELTNTLSCSYTMDDSKIPGFLRKDKFSTTLYTDDTGYHINATNTSMVGGYGCDWLVRLINKEKD